MKRARVGGHGAARLGKEFAIAQRSVANKDGATLQLRSQVRWCVRRGNDTIPLREDLSSPSINHRDGACGGRVLERSKRVHADDTNGQCLTQTKGCCQTDPETRKRAGTSSNHDAGNVVNADSSFSEHGINGGQDMLRRVRRTNRFGSHARAVGQHQSD